jgi:hypothetical protein
MAYILSIIILAAMIIFTKPYWEGNYSNRARRVKSITMDSVKKTPKPLVKVFTEKTKNIKAEAASSTPPTELEKKPESEDLELSNLSTQELVIRLTQRMKTPVEISNEELEQISLIADELIVREPEIYQAYKAKLFSLLVREGKFKESIEDLDVDSLLETMASFSINNRENLIVDITSEEESLNIDATELYSQIEENYMNMQVMDPNTPEYFELERVQQELTNQYKDSIDRLDANQKNQQEAQSAEMAINRDIVEIPFMRMMAKSDYDGVIQNAENFIEEFPNLADGYYYLYKAYEAQGANEKAQQLFEDINRNPQVKAAFQEKLENFQNFNLQTYWQTLRF